MDWGSIDRAVQRLDDTAAAAELVVVQRLELLRRMIRLHIALLCRHHHRLIHENGWTLHVDHQNRWVASDLSGIEWTGRPRGHTPRPRHREPASA